MIAMWSITSPRFFARLTRIMTASDTRRSPPATPDVPIALAARASIPIVFAPVVVVGGLMVDGGTCDNMPVSDLTVDNVPRVGIHLVSDDPPLPPGSYGLATLASRIIDLMLAACEATHVALDSLSGASIVRVPTGYVSTFDRHMPVATRQRLYGDG
ncbi:patatin-like phospholipase family protein [Burkholderia ubonensis]|uniref:patatin-like phospholipase family protein n=2 Tax=Burkholderia ubonensis TaxID=101571 RepID=UPI00358ECF0A